MILVLRITQYQNSPPPQDMSIRVGEAGCNIGRKQDNDLVLPDSQRVISNLHARINRINGEYYLTDMSTNGTYHNDQTVEIGKYNSVLLNPGDRLIMGDYVISIYLEQSIEHVSEGQDEDWREWLGMPVSSHDSETASKPPETDPSTEAVRAYFDGVGISVQDLPPGTELQFLSDMGRLMRNMVQGLMANLSTRKTVKDELRLEMTAMRAIENNPLKVSVDVDDALRRLLGGQDRGYLSPLVAVNEALDDMVAHQMAVLAAMYATLDGLVARFDPGELERTFKRDSIIKNLVSHTPIPKAKYWELFTKRFKQIANDAEEGFTQLFDAEFTRAYEGQIKAFKKARISKNG